MRPSLRKRDQISLCLVMLCIVAAPVWGVSVAPSGTDNSRGVALPIVHHATDSDGLTITKLGLGVYPGLVDFQHWRGIELHRSRYGQDRVAMQANALLFSQEYREPRTGLGHSLRLGIREDTIQTDWILDANRSWAFGEAMRLEFFAQRDRVESIPALQAGITMNLVGAAVDYSLHPRLTAVAAASKTWFSDDAARDQQRLRIIGDLLPEHGLTLQWSLRRQSGSRAEGVEGPRRYFNPEDMTESVVAVGLRRRVEGWQLQARVGFGSQEVLGERSPTRQLDLWLTTPLDKRTNTRLRAGAYETFGLSGPGYRYRFIDLQTVWLF